MRLREFRLPASRFLLTRSVVVVRSRPAARYRLRNEGRRARRALAWLAAVFLAVQGAALAGRESLHDRIFVNKVGLLRDHLAVAPPGERVFVMGSSRVLFGLDAAAANEVLHARSIDVFNFGVAAAGPVTQNLYFRRLLAQGFRPDDLVVEILPAFFHADDELSPMEARWLKAQRLTREEQRLAAGWKFPIGDEPPWSPLGVARVGLLAHVAPVFLNGEENIDGHRLTDRDGFARAMTSVTPTQRRKGVEGARRQYEPYSRKFRPGGPGPAALDDLLALCRENGIRVALLRMPEGAAFRAFYGNEKDVDAWVDSVAQAHACAVIDARRWVADEGFHDGHHLIPSGAMDFTARFARGWRHGE